MIHNANDFISATITMGVLHYVVEKIGRDWKVLSWALGVRDEVLDNIEKTCWNIPHIALAALNNWYSVNQEHATKEILVMALRDSGRNDIADTINLMEWWKKIVSYIVFGFFIYSMINCLTSTPNSRNFVMIINTNEPNLPRSR